MGARDVGVGTGLEGERERVHWSELGHPGEGGRRMKRKGRGGMRKEGSFSQWQSRHCAAVCLEGGLRISGDFF